MTTTAGTEPIQTNRRLEGIPEEQSSPLIDSALARARQIRRSRLLREAMASICYPDGGVGLTQRIPRRMGCSGYAIDLDFVCIAWLYSRKVLGRMGDAQKVWYGT